MLGLGCHQFLYFQSTRTSNRCQNDDIVSKMWNYGFLFTCSLNIKPEFDIRSTLLAYSEWYTWNIIRNVLVLSEKINVSFFAANRKRRCRNCVPLWCWWPQIVHFTVCRILRSDDNILWSAWWVFLAGCYHKRGTYQSDYIQNKVKRWNKETFHQFSSGILYISNRTYGKHNPKSIPHIHVEKCHEKTRGRRSQKPKWRITTTTKCPNKSMQI